MRVAVVSDFVRPNGAGLMALLAAEMLTDAGHDVAVIGGAMTAPLERSIDARHGFARAFTNDEKALDGSVTATGHIGFRRTFRRWFDATLADFRPEVLYVHNCGRVLDQLELVKLSAHVPVAHVLHDEWFFTDAHYTFEADDGTVVRTYEPGRSESLIEHRYEHLFEVPGRAGVFTAIGPSRWISDRARRVFPTLDVAHIPNAVDSAFFDLQDRTSARTQLGLPLDVPIVLFVGSPSQQRKGFRQLEAALREVGADPVRLVAGGSSSVAIGGAASSLVDGPLLDRVLQSSESPAGALGIDGPGVVVSGLSRSWMPAMYGAADVLVHPSRIDNLPTVPIEAGLCGTRCLASDVGGTAETIVDPDDLFPVNLDAESLARRIDDALNAARSETTADRQRRRDAQLTRFGMDAHRDAVVPLLESLAARGQTPW